MTTLMVLYGRPRDAKAFDQHYAARHLPLVERLPGLKGIALSQPGIEVMAGGELHLVARLSFASSADLKAAMASPEGQAAAGDLAAFADGGAQIVAFDEVVVRVET